MEKLAQEGKELIDEFVSGRDKGHGFGTGGTAFGFPSLFVT